MTKKVSASRQSLMLITRTVSVRKLSCFSLIHNLKHSHAKVAGLVISTSGEAICDRKQNEFSVATNRSKESRRKCPKSVWLTIVLCLRKGLVKKRYENISKGEE